MKITQLFLLVGICMVVPLGSVYSMEIPPDLNEPNRAQNVNVHGRPAQRALVGSGYARILNKIRENTSIGTQGEAKPVRKRLDVVPAPAPVINIKNDNNAPQNPVVVVTPAERADTLLNLDAFVADFTPEEYELNFGHKRAVNPPMQDVREVIAPVVPVASHREQARAAERARASAELFARLQNADNSTSVDFKDLLDRGADINGYHNGLTPLLEAVRQGHPRVCESLIAQGADVNLPMNGDYSIDLVHQGGEWYQQSFMWRLTLQNHDQEAGSFRVLHHCILRPDLGIKLLFNCL